MSLFLYLFTCNANIIYNFVRYGGLSSSGGYKPSSYSRFGGGYHGDRYDDDCYGSQNGGKFDGSPSQRKDDYAYKYKDQNLNGQDGDALHNKSIDKYEDDDFARIRDHDDDRFVSKKEYDDEDSSFSGCFSYALHSFFYLAWFSILFQKNIYMNQNGV